MRTVWRRLLWPCALVIIVLVSASLACGPKDTPTVGLTPSPTPTSTPVIITSAGVLRRIDRTMILETTVFRIDTVVRAKADAEWWEVFKKQNLLVFVEGAVTAGMDLADLDEKSVDVSDTEKRVTITLPPAKVLRAELISHSVETYTGQPPEKVDLELYEGAKAAGREQIAETACESGILDYATRDAERAMKQIFGFLDLAGYEVVVESAPAMECSIEVK